MSPPRKTRTRKVDDNNTQPVSSLIGFFETDPPDDVVGLALLVMFSSVIHSGRLA